MPFRTSILYLVSCIKGSFKKYTKYIILNTKYRKASGFTLVELLIGIALIAGLSVIIFQIYLSHFKIFSGQSLAISVASENQIAMDEINNTARQAVSTISNCAKILCQFNGAGITNYFEGAGISPTIHLTLTLWPLDSSGNPINPASTSNCIPDYISYYLDSPSGPAPGPDGYSVLKRETAQFSSSTCPTSRQKGIDIIATKVKSLNFSYTPVQPNTTEVKITITNEGNALFKPFKPYTYTRTSLARLKNHPGLNFVPLLYAVHSANSIKTFIMHFSSQVTGNVYSNGNICGVPSCNSGEGFFATINGSAWAGGIIEKLINVVGGTKTQGASYLGLPDIRVNSWIAKADAGGEIQGPFLVNSNTGNRTLGPTKINGDLTLDGNVSLTLNGPVHVTGNLYLDQGGHIYLNNSLGSQGTAIIVDGLVDHTRNTTIHPTDSTPKGFLTIISTKTGTETVMDIQHISGHAVFYSAGTAYIRTDYISTNGSTNLTGALLAPWVDYNSLTIITYDPDLSLYYSGDTVP